MKRLRAAVMFLVGAALSLWAADGQHPMLTFLGLALVVPGWTQLLALPGEGRNPRPDRPNATAQARSYELELVEEDEASGVRAVVVEFLARPLTRASVETLDSELELVMRRGEEDFSRVLAGGRESKHIFPSHPIDRSVEDWSCKRNGHVFVVGDERCVQCRVKHKEVAVSPVAQKVRYSDLEYRKVLIVNGSEDAISTAGFDAVQHADLVVTVRGNTFRIVKDRFGKVGVIDAGQLTDIRSMDNVRIVQA